MGDMWCFPMDDYNRLKTELRAAREERVRRERGGGVSTAMVPDIDQAFRRLKTLSDDELNSHINRLERDLRSLETNDLTDWMPEDALSGSQTETSDANSDADAGVPLFETGDEADSDEEDASATDVDDDQQTRLDANWTGDD